MNNQEIEVFKTSIHIESCLIKLMGKRATSRIRTGLKDAYTCMIHYESGTSLLNCSQYQRQVRLFQQSFKHAIQEQCELGNIHRIRMIHLMRYIDLIEDSGGVLLLFTQLKSYCTMNSSNEY